MTLERRIAALFAMDEAAWARHTNPWSGWTRLPALSMIALAVWSRDWIGAWAWLALAFVLAWVWVNPRIFPAPAHQRAWISRAVLGERLWLARDETPVPAHHRLMPHLLSGLVAAGVLLVIWGLVALDPAPLFAGLVMNLLGKLWFLDRMVWLHEDMTG